MRIFDIVLMILIAGGAFWLLYRSLWKKKGCCSGSDCSGCNGKPLERGLPRDVNNKVCS